MFNIVNLDLSGCVYSLGKNYSDGWLKVCEWPSMYNLINTLQNKKTNKKTVTHF